MHSTTASANGVDTTDDTITTDTKKLEGAVSVSTTLNTLKDARLSISRLRKAIANLFDEMTRQDTSMMYVPDVVGATFITTARPVSSGQRLPPRKNWVDEAMHEISPIMKLFKEDVDAAIENNNRAEVSSSARQKLDPMREDAFKRVKNSFDLYEKLEKLTEGPPYQADQAASLCEQIDREMKQLDKTLKRGMGILKKEQKYE
ncbi:MAG: hypothetical protein K2Z81_19800 [Cyanobacteria bacterium]|nr:hypothetical protein [Cyanobacteriota bacterium]